MGTSNRIFNQVGKISHSYYAKFQMTIGILPKLPELKISTEKGFKNLNYGFRGM